jgi:hypothetical protein
VKSSKTRASMTAVELDTGRLVELEQPSDEQERLAVDAGAVLVARGSGDLLEPLAYSVVFSIRLRRTLDYF